MRQVKGFSRGEKALKLDLAGRLQEEECSHFVRIRKRFLAKSGWELCLGNLVLFQSTNAQHLKSDWRDGTVSANNDVDFRFFAN
mmetsp:Transcript_9974/g.24890  ORF Transcript_9974/g.24890 Transcript_9974/m.24890 type:complete len:84 (-) Transcript_9974:1216-1467(-)